MANTSFSEITNTAKRWVDYLSPVLLLLVIIWLCWNLSRLVWLFLAPVQAPNLSEVARQTQVMPASNPNTFMIFAEPKINEAIAPQSAVVPSNIKLKGVMVATPKENSSALLDVDGKVSNYRVTQKINNTNYTLNSVDWNKVILVDSSNNELTLKMNEPFQLNQKLKVNPQNSENQAMITDMNAPAQQPFDSSTEFPMGAMGNGGQAENDMLEENDYNEDGNNGEPSEQTAQIEALKENPAGYLGQMGMLATQDGYEVTEAMPNEFRSKSGLQLGDKIISINGDSVGSDPIIDAENFAKAKESGQAQIQIKRGEQVITINKTF
ncbi:MAG: PDZ domain-containing protein [Moraxellaceae bacterium]|nr:PDZ domain-containing protein [Moraxellaceae bacterium]